MVPLMTLRLDLMSYLSGGLEEIIDFLLLLEAASFKAFFN